MSDGNARQSGATGDFGSLLADRWRQLSPLVDVVLDAPPEQRSSVLMEVSGGDPQLRAEVERLVAECERGVTMLDRPAAEGFSNLLVDDAEAAIPEILGGRYRIEREVGRGGMSRVYLARDLKHSRSVAVKVIRGDLAASLGRDRFLREIEIAARLRHPNIVPVYDSGDAGNPRDSAGGRALYFVMPYEEGPSLRERLRIGPGMSPGECVNVLRDVARALAYAHEHGVVHRDVKPDNVMLSSGAAVVTDFGIAKAIAAASGDDRPERDGAADPLPGITQVGSSIGTPAYMAPEQAVGDPSIDHRADIYSFGCLAYELFAGHPPFHGLPTNEVIAAHVETNPVPLSDVSVAVPESVAQLVARCLQKRPAARPQSAQDLLTELDAAQTTGPNAAVRRRRRLPRAALATLGVIVGLALIGYLVTRDRTSVMAKAPRPVRAVDPEARRRYELGQRGLTLRGQQLHASVEHFTRATELDTLYAEAFGGLSLALALSPYFENISTREVSGAVRSAAERALRLDPTLAPPHVALGMVHQYAYHWDSAAAEFETAVRLRKPDDIEPLVQYGRYMLHQGRAADALKQFLIARRAEPASALVTSWLAYTYSIQGQMDSALVEIARAFQNDSTNYTTLQNGAGIRLDAGDFAGARDLASRLTAPYDRVKLRVLALTGDTAAALERLRELERKRPTPWLTATTRAYVMFAIGDTTEAMAALERATDAYEQWPASGSVLSTMYDPVRSSARFHALLRRVNLPLNEATIGPRPVSR